MINYDEAYRIFLKELSGISRGDEYVHLTESPRRISSEDIISNIELPSFNNSAMDGIAVRFSSNVKKWKRAGETSAGNQCSLSIKEDEAVLITTGAMIPQNCDTVIPLESLQFFDEYIELIKGKSFSKGDNIRIKGQDLKAGELLIEKDSVIRNFSVPILASCGYELVKVRRKLSVSVFTTGDELIDITESPVNGKVIASNLYSVITMLKDLNLNITNCGIVRDNETDLLNKLNQILSTDTDMIISTGGVSVGNYDLVSAAVQNLGFRILFWKANIKPGKPILMAVKESNGRKTLYIGLPGNPVSAMTNLFLFVHRAVNELLNGIVPEYRKVTLTADIRKTDSKRYFVFGKTFTDPQTGEFLFLPNANQSSSNMTGLSSANSLLIIEEDKVNPGKGDIFKCIMI